MTGLLIIGGGGHGMVVADAALEQGAWQEIAFLDDQYPSLEWVLDWPVVGKIDEAGSAQINYTDAAIGIGDNQRRLELLSMARDLGFNLPVIRHPGAVISRSADIGAGTVVFAQSAINAKARLGEGCVVNTGATIDHDCVLADGVHVSPGAHLGGGVRVGRLSWVGIGSCVRELTVIGEQVMLGAGAAAVGDIPDRVTVTGVPAAISSTVGTTRK